MTMVDNHEFEFSHANFNRIRQFVLEQTGIVLGEMKKEMVYARIVKRFRSGEISSFEAFCDEIDSGNTAEQDFLINAITTNLTAFFRENHHFDYLATTVIPELIERNKATKRIRIWSSGCSTGEEPYSIAMILREYLPDFDDWDVKILATDLDANAIAHGEKGIYNADRVIDIDDRRLQRWFKRGRDEYQGLVKVHTDLQNIIRFKRLNLLHQWPMSGPFDAIFCRNVVIYFDKATQREIFERYANILSPKGYLFLGHSESLYKVSERFDLIGQTVYKKAN